MRDTADKANRNFRGQLELHDVIVHELLEPLVNHPLAIGVLFVLNQK